MAFILECLASIQQSSYPVNPLVVCFSVGGVRFAGNFPGSRQAGAWVSSGGLEHARGTTGEILSGGPQVRSCQGGHRGDLVRGTTGEILSGDPKGRYCQGQGDHRGDLVRGTAVEVLSRGQQGRSCQGDHRRDLVL